MFPSCGKKRCGQVAAILQLLFLGLVACNLGLRLNNFVGARLSVDDVRLLTPADAIPSVALNRGAKSFPDEIRIAVLGTQIFQPIQPHYVATAPTHHTSTPLPSPLLGSLLIRAPPAL
ncbi:MAG TPA: hypothetical protein VGA27_05155, partial [Candidatus Binatia bacterium]